MDAYIAYSRAYDVVAGTEQIYSIQGTALHLHSVTVTAAHFVLLQAGGSVAITSSITVHSHSVTITCRSS